MILEVNEQTIAENATEDDLKQLDFKQTVALFTDVHHYFQLWIDEACGEKEFYYCVEEGTPKTCSVPDNVDSARLLELFSAFLKGDQSWAEKFDWVDAPESFDDAEMELEEDQWEVYPCQFEDGEAAIVFYDHGVSELMESIQINQFVSIQVKIKDPDPNGFATDAEESALKELEDALGNAIYEQGGFYVGRISFGGQRQFYSYLDAKATEVEELLGQLREQFEYDFEFFLETDPEKSRYWDELYPPEEGLNLIMDSKLVDLHAEEGDQLEAPRPVDFWIDLPSEAAVTDFESWARGESFSVSRHEAPESEEDPFSIVISKEMAIELSSVYSVSSQVLAKANELEGEYVGWECPMVEAV